MYWITLWGRVLIEGRTVETKRTQVTPYMHGPSSKGRSTDLLAVLAI
jgi:hypothetical protein